jgi:hypothetical protein
MVTYLPRSAWKARTSRGATALAASNIDGEALHWPGMAKPINATGTAGQARVASALRGWQNYHMDVRGWSDIAYQIAIDQAGRAWTLRGLNIRSGANGDADVNLRFGAFLLILAPGEQPSAAMIATTKGVIADFRKRFPGARLKPYGHRDVRPRNSQGQQTTDCPGDIAESLINAGKFTPGTVDPPVKPPVKPPVTPPSTKDIIDMATQAEVAQAVSDGIRMYMKDFFTDEQGTGDSLADAAAERGAAEVAKLDELIAAVKDLTAAVNAKA